MLVLDEQQQAARDWFEALRDRICSAFEEIEREAGSDMVFQYTPWDRDDPDGSPGGGPSVVASRPSSQRASTARKTIRAFSRPGSAWSRTWRIRMCPQST
jgi:hypothetical protein